MFPESSAPPLPGLEEFREAAARHGLKVRREYTPKMISDAMRVSVSDFEHPPEEPGWWDVILYREERLPDDKIYARMLVIPDRNVGFREYWDLEFELFNKVWEIEFEKAKAEHS